MVARLKQDDSRIGIVQRVYMIKRDDGTTQARMEVRFTYGSVDADVNDFIVSEQSEQRAKTKRSALN